MKTKNNRSIHPDDHKDILELEYKISQLKSGKMPEDRFRHYRLTRGVYGQRQSGVQMFRVKLPYGKVHAKQLETLAQLAESYGNNNLHITTRQNIQLHYVRLSDSPSVWKGLAASGLTAREACGNTVRNITASAKAGIDPDEPFDVTPYVQATFEYFLRNPICQDMGRKIKMAFSSSEKDSAYTYFHDFGFIPRVRKSHNGLERGFKVVIGGGLGAQSIVAPTAAEFMPIEEIIPFMEAAIRIFDRFGERQKRQKARMKFLIKKWGVKKFLSLIEEEKSGLQSLIHPIELTHTESVPLPKIKKSFNLNEESEAFETWKRTNVFEQKQKGFFAASLTVPLGDLKPDQARRLASAVLDYAADDIRFTVNQGILLRYIPEENLAYLYQDLLEIGLANPGFGSTADVTACPGTDTCALGVTNSTGLASVLSDIIKTEYPELLERKDLHIKLSGCMNSCGQHMAASIGFHGSSIKNGPLVIPAMQVVLGGGIAQNGEGYIAQKVIKLPTKRIPQALRLLLDNFQQYRQAGQEFNQYFIEKGKIYFYDLLKILASKQDVNPEEYFDWNQDRKYIQNIGVGECAGVSYDMVGAIIGDAVEKMQEAEASEKLGLWREGIYQAYTAMIIGAKAILLTQDIKCNTHIGIIEDFDARIVSNGLFAMEKPFAEIIFQIKHRSPEAAFGQAYIKTARSFIKQVVDYRVDELQPGSKDRLVLSDYYKA